MIEDSALMTTSLAQMHSKNTLKVVFNDTLEINASLST